jgi:N-acyl-D-aspartate/D-glutamate deacylase
MVEYDILIEKVSIVDGTGKKPYLGNIGIKDEKIATIGETSSNTIKTINGKGLTAFPGFIDAHSHADISLLWYPKCESYLMQGVTTFIGGQCGHSPAPLGDYMRMPSMLEDYLVELEPYKYYPKKSLYPVDQVNEWMEEKFGWTIKWRTMKEFFTQVEETGISMNYAPLVGHGSIRTKVMGNDYKRHTTPEEQKQIQTLIRQAIEEGCIGLSTGLDYDPDVFASHQEIIESVRALKDYPDVLYTPHWRRTGRRRDVSVNYIPNERITALMECVDVHKQTGVRLHFAHLLPGWEIYPPEYPEMDKAALRETIKMITQYSKTLLDITCNTILYTIRGGFAVMPYLCGLLEPWLRELGSREALAKWLKVQEFRDEILAAIRSGKWFVRLAYNPNTNPRWADNIFVVRSKSPELDGKTIKQIAEERKADPWDTYLNIIVEDPDTRGVLGGAGNSRGDRQRHFDEHYTHPKGMISLDTSVFDYSYQKKNPPYRVPGINTYSAFPLFYEQFVLDEKIFTPEKAIQKMSTMAAKVHNLQGRGTLTEGSYGDVVLMDEANLKILGNEYEPRQQPQGIEWVLVNGTIVVEKGKHSNAKPGKILKREAK